MTATQMVSPVTKKLSRPQLNALRYVKSRSVFAADINGGNGNLRRTLLWLITVRYAR